jgi:hypothetical protein
MIRTKTRQSAGWPAKLPPGGNTMKTTGRQSLSRSRCDSMMNLNHLSWRRHSCLPVTSKEIPLRAGTIFEADDGQFNFYAWIPWPTGGDRCSDRFGVRLGCWQLLVVVDARWEFCPAFDIVVRGFGPSHGGNLAALIGRTMREIAQPALWRLGQRAWAAKVVRDGLKLGSHRAQPVWQTGQKSAGQKFFNRLWVPAALIPGHLGRDCGRTEDITTIAHACQGGRADPREYFISLESAIPRVTGCVQFANTEPVESAAGWGCWIPWERFGLQLKEQPTAKLDPSQRFLFAREQRVWTVRDDIVGGLVARAGIRFPVHFQCEALREFAGHKIKACFDPWAERITGTLVLLDAWRGRRAGQIIARDIPALETTASSSQIARQALASAFRSGMWHYNH